MLCYLLTLLSRAAAQVPANEGERAEQLEVASQCLCDAFEIELEAAAPEFSLAEIYRAGVESLVRRPCSACSSLPLSARRACGPARRGRAERHERRLREVHPRRLEEGAPSLPRRP